MWTASFRRIVPNHLPAPYFFRMDLIHGSPMHTMHAKSFQSCLTLCKPMDCSPPGSSVVFSRQEYCSGLPCLPPGDLPNPGIEPTSLIVPALAGRFFIASASWEALCRAYLTTKVLYWFLSTVSVSPHTQLTTTTHTTLRKEKGKKKQNKTFFLMSKMRKIIVPSF